MVTRLPYVLVLSIQPREAGVHVVENSAPVEDEVESGILARKQANSLRDTKRSTFHATGTHRHNLLLTEKEGRSNPSPNLRTPLPSYM